MSWLNEIFRCFFVAFGMTECITNLFYLFRKDGLNLATKQHGELPKGISVRKIKLKVCCMLIAGLFFFFIGIMSFINKSVNSNTYILVLLLFSAYEICEAVYYKYWKTTCASLMSISVTALYVILSNVIN